MRLVGYLKRNPVLPYDLINLKSVQAVIPVVCISLLLLYSHKRLCLSRNYFFRIVNKIIMCNFRTFAFRTCTRHPVHLIPLDLIVLISFFEHYEVFQCVIVSESSYVLSLIPSYFPQHSIDNDPWSPLFSRVWILRPFPYITRDKVKIPLLNLLTYSYLILVVCCGPIGKR